MKAYSSKFSLHCLLAVLAIFTAPIARAAVYQWSAQTGGENRRNFLWIPEDCKRIRGLIVVFKNLNEIGITDNPVVRKVCQEERIGIVWISEDYKPLNYGIRCQQTDFGWFAGLCAEDEKEYNRLRELLKAKGTTPDQASDAQAKIDAWNKELTAKARQLFDDSLQKLADESGYKEVARAPICILSHSMGSWFCWRIPYWMPERIWGSLPIKTGVSDSPPPLKPGSNMHGVPHLYINCYGAEGPDGHTPEWNCAIRVRKDKVNLLGQVFDWGGTHFDMTDDLAKLVALFINKASKYRLSDEIPATGYPALKDLKPENGWLATSLLEPQQFPMAPEPQYKGEKSKAFWFFDEEMAKAAINHNLANRKKQPQYVTVVSNGNTLQPPTQKTNFNEIGIPKNTGVDDGFTFKLTGAYLDTVPFPTDGKVIAAGHAPAGKVVVKLTGGNNLVKLDEDTFRYREFNRGPNGHGWVVASAPGDANYARSNYQACIWLPLTTNQGTPQTIAFPEIPNVPAGTKQIELKATSDVPGQVVEYYVVSGPAEITGTNPKYTGSTLRFTPIPPNAKYPVKVIVGAYQMGRTREPLVRTAPEVVREFHITNCRAGISAPVDFEKLEINPVTQRPCLLMDPSDIPEVRRRFEALPNHPRAGDKKMDAALCGLLYDDVAARKKATADFMADVRTHLSGDVVDKFGPQTAYSSLRRCRRFNELLIRYDIVASFGCLSKEDQREFEEDAVRAAKYLVGDDPAKFPSPQSPSVNGLENPKGFSTCNRWADRFMGAVLVGLNFPDQPLAKPWVRYGLQQIQFMLDRGNWDGAWNECPRYHNATLRIFSTPFQALQRRTGVDLYQNPNLKQLLDWYVRFSSPLVRLPETAKNNPVGEPTLPVWGDSNYGSDFFSTLALYAPHFTVSDPNFSKRLMWMWKRAGSQPARGSCYELSFSMEADPSLPDAPQILGGDLCKKFGYVVMRSGFDTPNETAVYMRGGEHGITHKHSDLGSIDLFSQGIPLALASQSGQYNASGLWNSTQQAKNVVVFGGKSRDGGECSGKIDAFFTSPQVDYAVADCSRPVSGWVKREESFHWRRHLLLVKNPDYLVVWDEIASPMPSEWFLHTTAEKLIWSKSLIASHTAYNADLDIHVLSPSYPLVPNEKKGQFGSALKDPQHPGTWKGKADPYPFNTLKYFSLSAKPGEDFITVLHPRKPNNAALTATLVSSSKERIALKITNNGKTDKVTLGADGACYQRDDLPVVTIPMQIQEPGKL